MILDLEFAIIVRWLGCFLKGCNNFTFKIIWWLVNEWSCSSSCLSNLIDKLFATVSADSKRMNLNSVCTFPRQLNYLVRIANFTISKQKQSLLFIFELCPVNLFDFLFIFFFVFILSSFLFEYLTNEFRKPSLFSFLLFLLLLLLL